ncbi:hypothetical protein HK405_005860 [Cladochytrium tenue]|nr:hypothetical protein HK405_005860 [Cladochytrium tenue]
MPVVPPGFVPKHPFDEEAVKTWLYPTNRQIRDYQFNIAQACLFTNTLVALPTGLGKTFIAAVVMFNFFRWFPEGKIVFMAPTKPLVAQQIEACYNITGIPQDATDEMTGQAQPEMRRASWNSKRVFFLTPQVLQNDLAKGSCPAERVVLLVVDEAHRALGRHAYCEVVRLLKQRSSSFRVLALTATPGAEVKTVQLVIDNLMISHIEIRTEESFDIRPYTFARKLDVVVVKPSDEIVELSQMFARVIGVYLNRLVNQKALYEHDARNVSRYMVLKARERWRASSKGGCSPARAHSIEADFGICMSLADCMTNLMHLGVCMFLKHIETYIDESVKEGARISKTRADLLRSTDFNDMVRHARSLIDRPGFVSHPKLSRMAEIVVAHFVDHQEYLTAQGGNPDAVQDTRVMIFSQYRDTVDEIVNALAAYTPMSYVESMQLLRSLELDEEDGAPGFDLEQLEFQFEERFMPAKSKRPAVLTPPRKKLRESARRKKPRMDVDENDSAADDFVDTTKALRLRRRIVNSDSSPTFSKRRSDTLHKTADDADPPSSKRRRTLALIDIDPLVGGDDDDLVDVATALAQPNTPPHLRKNSTRPIREESFQLARGDERSVLCSPEPEFLIELPEQDSEAYYTGAGESDRATTTEHKFDDLAVESPPPPPLPPISPMQDAFPELVPDTPVRGEQNVQNESLQPIETRLEDDAEEYIKNSPDSVGRRGSATDVVLPWRASIPDPFCRAKGVAVLPRHFVVWPDQLAERENSRTAHLHSQTEKDAAVLREAPAVQANVVADPIGSPQNVPESPLDLDEIDVDLLLAMEMEDKSTAVFGDNAQADLPRTNRSQGPYEDRAIPPVLVMSQKPPPPSALNTAVSTQATPAILARTRGRKIVVDTPSSPAKAPSTATAIPDQVHSVARTTASQRQARQLQHMFDDDFIEDDPDVEESEGEYETAAIHGKTPLVHKALRRRLLKRPRKPPRDRSGAGDAAPGRLENNNPVETFDPPRRSRRRRSRLASPVRNQFLEAEAFLSDEVSDSGDEEIDGDIDCNLPGFVVPDASSPAAASSSGGGLHGSSPIAAMYHRALLRDRDNAMDKMLKGYREKLKRHGSRQREEWEGCATQRGEGAEAIEFYDDPDLADFVVDDDDPLTSPARRGRSNQTSSTLASSTTTPRRPTSDPASSAPPSSGSAPARNLPAPPMFQSPHFNSNRLVPPASAAPSTIGDVRPTFVGLPVAPPPGPPPPGRKPWMAPRVSNTRAEPIIASVVQQPTVSAAAVPHPATAGGGGTGVALEPNFGRSGPTPMNPPAFGLPSHGRKPWLGRPAAPPPPPLASTAFASPAVAVALPNNPIPPPPAAARPAADTATISAVVPSSVSTLSSSNSSVLARPAVAPAAIRSSTIPPATTLAPAPAKQPVLPGRKPWLSGPSPSVVSAVPAVPFAVPSGAPAVEAFRPPPSMAPTYTAGAAAAAAAGANVPVLGPTHAAPAPTAVPRLPGALPSAGAGRKPWLRKG